MSGSNKNDQNARDENAYSESLFDLEPALSSRKARAAEDARSLSENRSDENPHPRPAQVDPEAEKAAALASGKAAHPPIPLDELFARVSQCRACPLCDTRTQTVFGVGNPHARVLFVGEAPGKNEDLQGEPFVGAAGKYLNELLAIAGLRREDVFIANVLKCRPPGNRDPQVGEIEACAPWLREQTRTINPDYIVTLGNFATKFILKTETGITRLHGTLQHAGRFKVFPIYHPAAALYDSKKREALEDDFHTLGRFIAEDSQASS